MFPSRLLRQSLQPRLEELEWELEELKKTLGFIVGEEGIEGKKQKRNVDGAQKKQLGGKISLSSTAHACTPRYVRDLCTSTCLS